MYVLLALLLFTVAGAAHVAAFVGARRMVGRALPEGMPRSVARGVAGVVAWYLAGSVLFAMGQWGRGETVIDEVSMRVMVAPSGPAARAGLRDGDRIVHVAGERVTSWDQLKSIIATRGDRAVVVGVVRGNETLELTATPEGSPPKILVGPWREQRRVGVGHAIAQGLVQPGKIVAATMRGLVRIASGRETAEVSGPVGIVAETARTTREGVVTGLLLVTALAAYLLPLVALGSAIHAFLERRTTRP